ncbi:MAG: glycoside hydrolase family 3 C-terminal domain-containing protein [Fimbriimonadales bacterium]|nr:glycoside hydrolase family 3 C-terminal domain-containing protein [Fimbriimonadales bacterium]
MLPQDRHADRIESLIGQMTLEEKAGQLNQEPSTVDVPLDMVEKGLVGSLICANSAYAGTDRQARVRAAALNELQRVAVERSRLGIPLLFARDVIHGHRTVGPIPLGQAASFWPEGVRRLAEIAAQEARADGIHWTFTPMLDIARDPRWGRIAEGFGEDPHLASVMAEQVVRGFQDAGLHSGKGMAACAKHYVAYGTAEGGRDYNTGEVTPTTLENVYLPPFKAAARAGVATVMAAFIEFDGRPATANPDLLNGILRRRWGWDGVIVSDWNAVAELVNHGVAADLAQAAELALLAGVDIDMAGGAYWRHLPDLVRSGRVPVEVLDAAVRRVLRLKAACGLFDDPYTPEDAAIVEIPDEHRRAARALAHRSIVLLKNQGGILPLRPGLRIGLVGPLANPQAKETFFGTWTLDGEEEDMTDLLSAMRAHAAPREVWHALLPDEAVAQARLCDVVVAVVGEWRHRSGEDNSTTTLDLPPGQTELLQYLGRIGTPLVAVVVAGRSLAVEPVLEAADAVLFAFHPGLEAGPAIADVLMGDAEPGGRLPVTFPRSLGQVPIYYNRKNTGRPVPNFRYRYVDRPDSPQFPFGFGLGYTTFEYSDLEVEVDRDGLRARVTVTNTGQRDGEEVVQLYLRDDVASLSRPIKELKAFQRVAIPAGRSLRVKLSVPRQAMGFFDGEGRLHLEPGTFTVWVGPNSEEGLQTQFRFDG